MRYDRKPVYRKLIVPWYDSETVCFIVIILMLLVFLFSLAGISVATENDEHLTHLWLPILLFLLSGVVIISTVFRLIKRYRYRYSKDLNL
ncbi:MAG: hypothetical protein JSU83_14690 [Deltaproteobacteria bacterium]|jgi:hypothetical protein|nr:MAG: hypothetical protein JSU83_14690 [Deltaproteobacteria bacterium]